LRLWAKIVIGIYASLCVAALVLLVIGTQGLFGTEPDGLAGVPAITLALPWSMITLSRLDAGALVTGIVLVLCMLLNIAVVVAIDRIFHRRQLTR
jgi:hypothetical protein